MNNLKYFHAILIAFLGSSPHVMEVPPVGLLLHPDASPGTSRIMWMPLMKPCLTLTFSSSGRRLNPIHSQDFILYVWGEIILDCFIIVANLTMKPFRCENSPQRDNHCTLCVQLSHSEATCLSAARYMASGALEDHNEKISASNSRLSRLHPLKLIGNLSVNLRERQSDELNCWRGIFAGKYRRNGLRVITVSRLVHNPQQY